ncbi:response regulator [Dyella sp. ASV21]|jgi:CheY-like chemotaxis protein|uniref:response regulator n=1 Tax=Dyella sp. ASV21 TaxID=2795114 RepID=UPI00210693D6|nr:response regulator [Dyella sp. ASV21]
MKKNEFTIGPPSTDSCAGTILLVEDDLDVQQMTRMILEDGGYRVLSAMNGTEALMVLSRHRVSVLVSDIHTAGGIDGIQLIHRLRQAGLQIPAILTSGDTPNRYGDYPEAITFIPKPYNGVVLLAAVSKVLDPSPGHDC